MLDVSRRNNARDDITGLLVYRGGNFLQALEGPEEMVKATMSRIARDPRHRSIVPLWEEWRDTRLFGHWAMGFENAERLDPATHPGVSRFLSRDFDEAEREATFREPGHYVVEFFQSFRDFIR